MQKGSAVFGPNRIMYGLIFLATFMSLGHHVDHVIRGNHIGWPFAEAPTPFTLSLAVYPAVLLGFYLTRRGKAGPLYWAVLWGLMTLLAASVHLPLSEQSETMSHIINPYSSPFLGWLAFLWLLGLVAMALVTCVIASRTWAQQRREAANGSSARGAVAR